MKAMITCRNLPQLGKNQRTTSTFL